MDDNLLSFDRKKHVLYSSKVKQLILDKLSKRYSPEVKDTKWNAIQNQYVKYLEDLPYLGGSKCWHNQDGGAYDTILMFSYYQCERNTPYLSDTSKAIKELNEMGNALFLPAFKRMGKLLNVNSKIGKRILHLAFKITAKLDSKISKKSKEEVSYNDQWPGGGYIMKVSPLEKERVYYRFDRCPIAEFAKKHNFLHIMPAFCNGDFPGIDYIHGSLIRNHTCSNSSFCDFLIVGDKSEDAKNHPRKVNDEGYIYTEKLKDFKY